MSLVPVSQILAPLIQAPNYARNGQLAPAIALRDVAQAINQCAALCGKELFTAGGGGDMLLSQGGAAYTVYRARIHTGPFCKQIRWYMSLARPDHGSGGSPRAVIELQNGGSGALISSDTATWGYGVDSGTPNTWGERTGALAVSPTTDYRLEFKVYDNARIANVLVHEEMLAPDTVNGYVANPGDRMLDDVRGAARKALYDLYRRAGAVVLPWNGQRTNATNTDTNLIDGTTTAAPSASSPGFVLDMRYKARQRDAGTGANCLLYAFGSVTTGSGGSVKVKNSAGTALATLTGFTTTPAWQSTALVLPATLAKYDLTFAAPFSSSLTISDVVIFEYET